MEKACPLYELHVPDGERVAGRLHRREGDHDHNPQRLRVAVRITRHVFDPDIALS